MKFQNVLSKIVFWHLFFCIAGFVGAFLTTGFTQTIMMAFGAAFFSAWLTKLPDVIGIKPPTILKHFFVIIIVLIAFMFGWYIGFPFPKEYPRNDGLIANFTTGPGGAARNVFGETFSIILDNDLNENSKCWYKLICSDDGNGFMRIYYELSPEGTFKPYSGVFTDFSHPPSQVFDISKFSKLSVRIRLVQPIEQSDIEVYLAIPTANVQGVGMYDYCEYQVPRYELQTTWVKVEAPFSKFQTPSYSSLNREFDLKQAFRFSFIIKASPMKITHGSIEIDDVQFEK